MAKREFATLLIRLLALFFIGTSLNYVTNVYGAWQNAVTFPSPTSPPIFIVLMLSAFPFLAISSFGIALWIFAAGAAALTIADDDMKIIAGFVELRAAAFTLAGALTIASAVPAFVAAFIFSSSQDINLRKHPLEEVLPIAQFAKVLAGIFLLRIGGVWLSHPRDWGRDALPPEERADADA